MKEVRLMLVDDHQMFLDGLDSILSNEEHLSIVGKAVDGKSALKKLDDIGENVDLVLMDVSMPEIDGIELNKRIKSKFPTICTIAISMHNDPEICHRLIKNDINGYLLKNAEKNELLKAIKTVMGGENYFSEEVTKTYQENLFKRGGMKKNSKLLSRREKEVLKEIMNEKTTSEIAETLFISQHTVETHRKNMLSKLNVRNTAGLVKYILENGISFDDGE